MMAAYLVSEALGDRAMVRISQVNTVFGSRMPRRLLYVPLVAAALGMTVNGQGPQKPAALAAKPAQAKTVGTPAPRWEKVTLTGVLKEHKYVTDGWELRVIHTDKAGRKTERTHAFGVEGKSQEAIAPVLKALAEKLQAIGEGQKVTVTGMLDVHDPNSDIIVVGPDSVRKGKPK